MKRSQLIAGVVCLVLAALTYVLGATKLVWAANSTITIYPVAFLALLGVVLLVRSGKR